MSRVYGDADAGAETCIADKGLLLTGIITLSVSNWDYEFPVWFPVLVIARDMIVVGGAMVLHMLNGTVHIRPSWTGKSSTAYCNASATVAKSSARAGAAP